MSKTALTTVRVSEKGQIAIPREIQALLGIQKGDKLVLAAKNKKILIQKAANFEKKIDDDFGDIAKYSESSLRKLWLNKKDNIWNQYLK